MTCREAVDSFFETVRNGRYLACKEQKAMCDWLESILKTEKLVYDDKRFQKYMDLQRFFPFKLFEWEVFLFAVHNCLFREDGFLRFSELFVMLGRGSGKNGFISFEAFALSSAINGIKNYNIDVFANSEKQAKTSPDEIREVLESDPGLKKAFKWNKETIQNIKTGSQISFMTSAPKTKDGGKPGMVIFDEYHAYENYDLITVAQTGLGKKPHPRKAILTTDGNIRGGPLDDMKNQAEGILFRGEPDLGVFPFICKLDAADEVDNELNWHKANPSLRYFPALLEEIRKEYRQYKLNPAASSAFMTKRMNLPPAVTVNDVTSWENILATNREMPDLTGCECVAGIDYAKTTDMVSAGLLFYQNGEYYWKTQSWVCAQSPALGNVKAPLEEWIERGLLIRVDANEISPETVVDWLVEQSTIYNITKIGMDNFRITLFRKYLIDAGFDVNDKNRVMLVKRVTQMRYAPVIQSAFLNHIIAWGDNPLMRWFTNNTFADVDNNGNITFAKKDAKYRMTDGFMALVAAFTASADMVENGEQNINIDDLQSFIF